MRVNLIILWLHTEIAAVLETESILGQDAARFVGMVDKLGLANFKTRYAFTAADDFELTLRSDASRGMQIYWGEILARAHLSAVTAVLRSRHWLSAVMAATRGKNLLSFAAAFRGLIESAADASSALGMIPGTLARDHSQITHALSGELNQALFIVTEIEDELIHFSYARHLPKAEQANVPASHRARHVRDYMDILEKGQVTDVVECYRALCDLTHPGATSVWMWLKSASEQEIILSARQDESIISDFLQHYRTTLLELLMFAFNPAIVTLNVLNYFPIEKLHVPSLLTWDLSGIPLWRKCRDDLRGIRPRASTASTRA